MVGTYEKSSLTHYDVKSLRREQAISTTVMMKFGEMLEYNKMKNFHDSGKFQTIEYCIDSIHMNKEDRQEALEILIYSIEEMRKGDRTLSKDQYIVITYREHEHRGERECEVRTALG